MFIRNKAAPSAPVKMVTLVLEPDDGSFEDDNGNQIEARGFSVKTSAGQHLNVDLFDAEPPSSVCSEASSRSIIWS
jgi:hypothetical protein